MSQSVSKSILNAVAPTGVLRASINLGNPILARKDPDTQAAGVSVDMARELSFRLGVELELVVVDAAGKSVDVVTEEWADVGFFAVDPVRGADISFTAPYVLIEGAYVVRDSSPLISNEQVDRAGQTITVGKGSAYDLYLTREIKNAQIVRAPTSQAVVDTFIAQGLDVAAGVKQQLESDLRRISGLRVLPGRFMVIQQAMGLPKLRDAVAVQFLRVFVEDMKASGFVAEALVRHGTEGASVAPASQDAA